MAGEASDMDIARCMLAFDEGTFEYPYDDSTGERVFLDQGKLTIGIGHNLEAQPLPKHIIEELFRGDYTNAKIVCMELYPKFESFSQARRLALINMAFNLGMGRLKGFVKMNNLVNAGEWLGAAKEARQSAWFLQVKQRGYRVTTMMQTNQIPKEYRGAADMAE